MHVCLILFPGFHLLTLSLVQEVLRRANACAGQDLFSWDLRSVQGAQTSSSDGVDIPAPAAQWGDTKGYDLILLCAGDTPLTHLPMGLRGCLLRAEQTGTTMAGIDGGALVLARLGLLCGREAVVQTGGQAGLEDTLRDVSLTDASFAYDRQRLTTAGGLAPADALLAWIGRVQSPGLAAQVGQALRRGHLTDTSTAQASITPMDPLIDRMQAIMMTHLDAPLPLDHIAAELELSPKQLRARCRKCCGQTPAQIYLTVRLDRADQLVRDTAIAIGDIAGATGFASPSAFTRAYRAHFGVTPRAVRYPAPAPKGTGDWVVPEPASRPALTA